MARATRAWGRRSPKVTAAGAVLRAGSVRERRPSFPPPRPGSHWLAVPPAGYVPGLGRKPRAGHRVSWQRRCEWAKRTSPPHAAPRPHLLPRSVREGRSAACRGRGPDRTGWALSPDPLPQWRVADVLATAIQRKPGEDRGAGTAPHAVPPRGTRALRLWMRPSRCGPSPLPQRGAVWVTRHFPGSDSV